MGRSSAVRKFSSAPSRAGGMTLLARRASPRSTMNVSPTTDANSSTPMIISSMVQLSNAESMSFDVIKKCKRQVAIVLGNVAAHFHRPRAVGRRVLDGFLAKQGEQIGNGALA